MLIYHQNQGYYEIEMPVVFWMQLNMGESISTATNEVSLRQSLLCGFTLICTW